MSFEDILNKVKQYPVLWDPAHKYYRRKSVQAESWAIIAADLDSEEKLVRSRWKYLKDQCRKELKKIASGEIDKSRWLYFNRLQFIKKELLNEGEPKPYKNVKYDAESEEPPQKKNKIASPEPCTSYSGQESWKLQQITTKLNELSKKIDNQNPFDDELRNNPDFMFLMSILPTIRDLTDVQKFTFRGKVNEWLLEALAQNQFLLSEQYQCKIEDPDS
ncbi:unnamed protein product [Pieris macdunnoughi]|uniref:MADF domain-containing protein n=1 Tax=Pieris macdunnoughi TaxID=345717 RepID=A0A821Y738_9NEOP|nr:unnamed protein product [Pieris macdunnoughi]